MLFRNTENVLNYKYQNVNKIYHTKTVENTIQCIYKMSDTRNLYIGEKERERKKLSIVQKLSQSSHKNLYKLNGQVQTYLSKTAFVFSQTFSWKEVS